MIILQIQIIASKNIYTVGPLIFACLNFRNFFILGLFTKYRNLEFSFFFSSAIIKLIFKRFLYLQIYHPRKK